MPDMGVRKPSWTSILFEPSGDAIPNYHSIASTEDPKGELLAEPSQPTDSEREVTLSLLNFEANCYVAIMERFTFPGL